MGVPEPFIEQRKQMSSSDSDLVASADTENSRDELAQMFDDFVDKEVRRSTLGENAGVGQQPYGDCGNDDEYAIELPDFLSKGSIEMTEEKVRR